MSLETPYSNNEKITNEWNPRHDRCILIAVTPYFSSTKKIENLVLLPRLPVTSILSDFQF